MKLHARAALTLQQRQEVKRLHEEEGVSIRKLATLFRVNPTTIQRWVKRETPLDLSTAPIQHRTKVTPEYRAAVIAYRRANPRHGPIRIASALRLDFPFAHRGTILPILRAEGLIHPPAAAPKPRAAIPVGRHRIQMDIQQLPAIKGGHGFEYNVSAIHLRTRVKYSEILPDHRSETMVEFLRRALPMLPPFFSSGPTTPPSSPCASPPIRKGGRGSKSS
jgi:hypothetical protein